MAEEIYFVTNGNFTLYIDIQDEIELPVGAIDNTTQAFNVPYSTYTKGSYFGDADCLCESKNND